MRNLSLRVCFLVFAFFAAQACFAQATDGNLVGLVQDPTAAAIPNAEIRLENTATGTAYTGKSDSTGAYRLNNVPVGPYKLSATAPGFGTSVVQNLRVELNRTTTANVTLQIGAVATQVEVSDAAALIDTTTAQITSTYDSRQTLDLPASAAPLGVLNLSLLSAGVASSGGLGVGDGPSIGGQRPRNNSFNIEGVDNNRKDVTGRNVSVPNEAVAQMTILQNQFSSEFGHSTGGQFNTIIKSGTNTLHGSVYEYLQNRKLNAVDEAQARQGLRTNSRYDQNNLGATIGGPVIKNKLFYFGSFEYNPTGQESSPSSAILAPTAGGYQALSAMAGISKTNLDTLRQYLSPAANATDSTSVRGTEIPIGIVPVSLPAYLNAYTWVASVDYNLSDRDQLRARYVENSQSGIDPSVSPNLPSFLQVRPTKSKLLSISEFHNLTPRLTNELRLAYNRYDDDIPAGNYNFPGLDMFPNITLEGDLNLNLGPFSDAPQSSVINTYQVVDNLNYTRGRHTLKFGGDGRKYIAPNNFIQRMRGDYVYSNLERYLLDLNPDVLAERNTGGTPYSGNSIAAYAYVNDEYRLRRNLTLNAGLRYEYKGIAEGMKLFRLNSLASVPGLIEFREPRAQKRNFAPRVGMAWSPGKSGNTSIRAGFGLGYDVLFDNFGTNAKPPQLETTVNVDVRQTKPGFLAGGGIPTSAAPGTLSAADARMLTSAYMTDQVLPYSIQWNFGVQHVFRNDYTFEIRYLGTRGVHLFTQTRPNVRSIVTPTVNLPTYLQRPSQAELDKLPYTLEQLSEQSYIIPRWEQAGFLSNITEFASNGNSIYHGLATELTRRFSRGLLFKAAHTWSHNIDDSTADLNSTALTPRRPQDFQDMRPERASSLLDRRHRFTLSWVWDAPWFKQGNWAQRNLLGSLSVAGTYSAETPEYATVQSGFDSNLNGDSASDRAIVNAAGEAGRGSDVTPLLNSAGNTVAYVAVDPTARYIRARPGAYANAGRNTLPLRGINNFDVSLIKRLPVTEGKTLEFRAMFYNALNHAQFTPGSINTVQSTARNTTRINLIPGNAAFGDPTKVFESNARIVTLAARFTF